MEPTNVEIEQAIPQRSEIEVIRDYTVVQNENTPVILVNPAHGNEPYILGTAIAREVSKRLSEQGLGQAKIVVPLMYGDRQRQILMEENVDDAGLIHYDEEFGNILRNILFQNGNYSDHLRQIESHYDDVESMLRQRFSVDTQNFSVRSLTNNEQQTFSPRNIVATIDTAARVTVEAPHRYFAFPILLTELLREAQKEDLGFSESDMQAVINRMLKVESAYSQVFIPQINPLSYQHAEDLSKQPTVIGGRSRIYTPAMKSEYERTHGKVPEPGIYVMFSGTGSATKTTRELVGTAKEAGLTVYSPPWVDVEGAVKISPDVLTDDNILGVFGRSGWGTGWQVQNLALPWFVAPYEANDDPEIYFNNKTIEALKIGKVLTDSDMTPEKLKGIIGSLSVGVQAVNERIRQQFGTLDGIDFIADAIATDFLTKK